MKRAEYLERRQALMDEAQALIDNGATDEEFTAKKNEVEALDSQWQADCQRQADLNALSDTPAMVDVQTVKGVDIENGKAVAKVNFADISAMQDDDAALFRSDEYVNTWAKVMMGKNLTDSERALVERMNTYTHTTENTGTVIPETVAAGIWDMIEESFPLWNDVQKTYVKGNYTVPISSTSSDAAWYDEATATADGTETFTELALTGCELSRAITVSWKLREMAVADFIPFIQKKIAQKMGKGLGYGVSHGKGKPGVGDTFKPEPNGIVTALKAETSTPQVDTYTAGSLAYADLAAQRAKIKVGAGELAYYANAKTIWTELATVKDGQNRPILVADPVNGGVTRVFGVVVKEDDSMSDGELLLGAPGVGYIANVNKDLSVLAEEHVKARTVDYCGYAIVDGGVISTKAFSLLEYASNSGSDTQGE